MDNASMLGFANTWAPVHAYYAIYGTLQGWFAANGMTGVANDHTATLRTISKQIEQRDLFPEPWNLLAVGCPMRKERKHVNDHGHDCTRHIEVLSNPVPLGQDPDFWPRMGTWLRSTRQARLTAREEQWKRKEKKQRISPTERTKIAETVAPTSIFDCFWRMRIKSNYGDVDPYLVEHISESDHEIYNRSMCTVTRATVALIELYTLRRIGKRNFATLATDFVAQDRNQLTAKMLRARLGAYGISL
jgi:hypothetical protein